MNRMRGDRGGRRCRYRACSLAFLLLALTLVASCSVHRLSGTYSGNFMSLTFESNGKVMVQSSILPGVGVECAYRIDGDKLMIGAKDQGISYIMTLLNDGSIQGPMGDNLTKEKKGAPGGAKNSGGEQSKDEDTTIDTTTE
jgi:hypothetical protein